MPVVRWRYKPPPRRGRVVFGKAHVAEEFLDSDTIPLLLTVTGEEGIERFDEGTITLVLTASGTDEITHVYEDSGTITLTLTPVSATVTTELAQDSFTDTTGTALQSHTGENATWEKKSGTGALEIYNNKLRSSSGFEDAVYLDTLAAPVVDCVVEADFTYHAGGNNQVFRLLAQASYQSDGLYAHFFGWNAYMGAHTISVGRFAAGSSGDLDTAAFTPSDGVTYHFKLVMIGTLMVAFIDGSEVLSFDDTFNPMKGVPGFHNYAGSSAGTGWEVDNLFATYETETGEVLEAVDSGTIYLTLTPGVAAGGGPTLTFSEEVIEDSPSFWWRLDEEFGIAARDYANVFSDQEIYATVLDYNDVNNLKGIQFFLNYDGVDDGYRVDFLNDSTSGTNDLWVISRIDGGTVTTLNSGSITNYQEGDIVGATVLKQTVYAWRHRAGVTTLIASHSMSAPFHEENGPDYNIISPSDFDFTDVESRPLGYGGLMVNTPTLLEDSLTLEETAFSTHFNDSQDEYVDLLAQVLNHTAYNAGMAMEVWFQDDGLSAGGDQGIFGAWKSDETGGPLIWLNHVDGTLMGVYGLVGLANYLDSGIIPEANVPYHVVYNYDGDTGDLEFWVNGVLTDTKNRPAVDGGLGQSDKWQIGRYNLDVNMCFAGWIQHAIIYPAPLSEARVVAHYNAGIGEGGGEGGEILVAVDSGTVTVTLTPTFDEVYEGAEAFEDSGTIQITLTASGVDTQVFVYADSGTIGLALTPSGTEERTITDADTIGLILTASGTDVLVGDDVATIPLTLTASGIDEYTGATHYTDEGTIYLDLTSSGTEERVSEDSNTVPVTLTPSGTEEQTTYDTGQVGLIFTASGSDTFQAIEASTVDLRFTPTLDEEFAGVTEDVGTIPVGLLPSGTEILTAADVGTINYILTPSGTDALVLVETGLIQLLLVPTVEELIEAADIAEIYLDLQPSGQEITTVLLMDLSSRAYRAWGSDTGTKNWTSRSFISWHDTAKKRWDSGTKPRNH